MKRSVILIAILVSTLSVFAILTGPGIVAGQSVEPVPAETPDYTITVGSSSFLNVQPGVVIARATPLASGFCDNDEIIIDVGGRRGYESVVSLSIDADCVIRFDGVSWERPPSLPMPVLASNSEERSAYTKSELNDEIGWDLLVAYAQIDYTDDGSELDNGDFDYECDVNEPTGWKLTGCSYSFNVHDSDEMWGWTRTQGKWGPETRYTGTTHGKAKLWVWPDEQTKHRCYNGRTLIGTHWRCRSGSS